MELFDSIEESNNKSIVYKVFVTRLKEYKNSEFNSQYDNLKEISNQNNEVNKTHIVSAVIMSTSVMVSGILAMGVFKIGIVYTLIVCIFVLFLLVFCYTSFVQPMASSLLYL